MVWQAGQSLYGNRYTIQKAIGKGGFGITYLAHDGKGRAWVIKTLKDEVMTHEEYAEYRDKYLQDFQNEALKLAIFRHPHIVQIENNFSHQGLPCIVMEYIQGMDLWQRLKQQGKLPEAEAVRYIRQIGEALIVVHDKGLLHRDLKPQNIMVRDSTDEAVLIDFGIAREFIPDLTQTHTKNGTFGFTPVEQYDDRAHRGEFTDVYALAATLATLVSGKIPQPSFNRAVRDNFQIPTGVSSSVQKAIRQGMVINPEDRTQTVKAWLEIIQVKPSKVQVPARYRQLEALLAAEKWEEGDQETGKVILDVANRNEEGYLDEADIDNFPGEDLRVIDGLWVKYSKGQFRFMVQQWLEILQVKPYKAQVPARYRQLEALLAAEKWEEGDQETAKVILDVANRNEEGYLDEADIDNFPGEDLRVIDGLWMKYSKGRFGLSVQKRIYQNLGGTREYNDQVWNNFGDRVGWRKRGNWLDCKEDITYDNKSLKGHLP